MRTLSLLNSGQDVDIPDWCVEPPSLFEPGYHLRQDIIWHKPNPMPESVTDRCTKAHEYIFMLSKSARYFYDAEAVKEPAVSTDARKFTDGGHDKQRGHGRRHAGFNGRYADKIALEGAPATRNRRSVWTVTTKPFKEAHFATFPPDLIEPCILAGCPIGGTVLDPFFGAGTTGLVAQNNGRKWIGIELNPKYAAIAKRRLGLASDPLHLWMTAA
jgi:DNA modification methylase